MSNVCVAFGPVGQGLRFPNQGRDCTSSTKSIVAGGRWRSWSTPGAFTLIAVMLAYVAMPEFARAGELEYQNCIRELCTSYGIDENNCNTQEVCLRELNGPNNTMPALPTLYGAIAVETDTLIFGYVKDVASREEAEQGALSYCRKSGGTASGCEIAVWGHNTCLALATSAGGSSGNIWGYAWSDEGSISRRDATAACRKEGGTSCKVAVSFCTG
jgi:hypothetical protein